MRRLAMAILVVAWGLAGCASERQLDGQTEPFVADQMKQHGVVR